MSADLPPNSRRAVFLRLLRFARPYLKVVAVAMLFAVVYSGARYLRAYLLKPLVDDVAIGGQSIEHLAVLVAIVIVALPVVHFGKDYAVEWTLGRILVDIQQALCSKLLALPLTFHHDRSRGDILSRALNDVNRSHRALNVFFSDVVQSVIGLIAGVATLAWISWQLTLVSLLAAPIMMAVIAFFGGRIERGARKRQMKMGDVTQRFLQILSGIKVIKAFRGEGVETEAFRRETRRYFKRSMKVVRTKVLARSLTEMTNNGISIGVLMLGALLVLGRSWGLSAGDLAAFAE